MRFKMQASKSTRMAGSRGWLRGAGAVGMVCALVMTGRGEDFADELPRIPITPPAEATAKIEVADGYRIEQTAAEPLVASPVAIDWDAAGRLFVCEMRGYSEQRDEGLSRIALLTDLDSDGVYDQRTTYLEGLLWPTAIFAYDGGLFVADPPHIYFCRDTDGDGRADERQRVITGFSISNVQGLVNSFRWGLDHRIHVACSTSGGRVRRASDPAEAAVEVRGHDLSFDPETFALQRTSGGGQHGMSFDDWGRKYVCSNSDHLQQVVFPARYASRNGRLRLPSSRLSIAADGPQAEVFRISPVEPWRIVRTRLRVGGIVPGPIEGGGRAAGYFTGATGVTIYRGDAWPQEDHGLAIIGDVGSNLIHRKRLVARGIPRQGERIDANSELVASRDIWFRPAQFANGPDGALHVVDVCREVIEHPKSLPPQIKQHLDLTAGRNAGRLYRIVPDDFQHRPVPNLTQRSNAQLIELLSHPNAWHRETAARVLHARGDDEILPLAKAWFLQTDAPRGRLHALAMVRAFGGLESALLQVALRDPHPQVRRFAIEGCESLPASQLPREALIERAADADLEVRYQLALSAGEWPESFRLRLLPTLLRRDGEDRWMRAAALSSTSGVAAPLLEQLLQDSAFRSAALRPLLTSLVETAGKALAHDAVLASVATWPQSDAACALEVLAACGSPNQAEPSLVAGWSDVWDARCQQARRQATDADLPVDQRVQAVSALRHADWAEAKSPLLAALGPREPLPVQQASLQAIEQINAPEIAIDLVKAIGSLGPTLQQRASVALLTRAAWRERLLDAVEDQQVEVGPLLRQRWQAIAATLEQAQRDRGDRLLSASTGAVSDAVWEAYRRALTDNRPGDPAAGRGLFRKHCAACHRVEGFGHSLGPSLASAIQRGPEAILVNVLDPNREVNPQYVNYVAVTDDGRTTSGVIAAESEHSVTLEQGERVRKVILRHEIESLHNTGVSLMPVGFAETLTPAQMEDLIAYLQRASSS